MKYYGRILSLLVILLTAGTMSLSAQRGMRGMRTDTSRIRRPEMGMMQRTDSLRRGMLGRDEMRMRIHDMPFHRFPMYGMPRPFRYGSGPGQGMRGPAPGMRFHRMNDFHRMHRGYPSIRGPEEIPGLTDDQRNKIEELQQKQRSEMQKFREDMQNKIREMRDSHRSKLMDLLTDEQKKWFDENNPRPTVK